MSEVEDQCEMEDRVDEYAVSQFAVLGFNGRLPDSLVVMYREFKRRKDMLNPGRLTPEGFAAVSLLAAMSDGEINFLTEG